MIKTELNLCLNETEWETALPEYKEISNKVVSLTINYVSQDTSTYIAKLNKELSFNLCLSNDQEIHALNKEFRGKDKPTNVLSFANIDDEEFETYTKHSQRIEMGDIIIALETMQHEAEEKHISLHDHFCHLLIHGILHLLGYDHIEDDEAECMENLEIEILRLLNINNPYEE